MRAELDLDVGDATDPYVPAAVLPRFARPSSQYALAYPDEEGPTTLYDRGDVSDEERPTSRRASSQRELDVSYEAALERFR